LTTNYYNLAYHHIFHNKAVLIKLTQNVEELFSHLFFILYIALPLQQFIIA